MIVVICTVLLQAHSIPFWVEQTQSVMGYLWSLTIEFVALWLWLNRKMILATVASAIIIFVPLLELSKPLLSEIRQNSINVQLSQLNDLNIKQSEALQEKYIGTNWAGTLIKNTEHFRGAIETQKELLLSAAKLKSNIENIVIILLQSIALIIVLLTQIQALRMLAFRDFRKLEIDSSNNFEISETAENRAETLLKQIEEYMKINAMSQSSLASKLEVASSAISKLRNRVSGTGEAISDKKMEELELKCESHFLPQ